MSNLVALNSDELLRLMEAASVTPRHHGLLLVSYCHGLRVSEAVSLRRSNFRDGFLWVNRLKGSNSTPQPLMSHSNPLLDEKTLITGLLREMQKGDYLCPSEWVCASYARTGEQQPMTRHGGLFLMKKYCRLAGIPAHKHFFHALKHSTARTLLDSGAQIDRVQHWMNHKSLTSTAAYLRVNSEQSAEAAMSAFAGIGKN
jgi:site-specific recombinase XerD